MARPGETAIVPIPVITRVIEHVTRIVNAHRERASGTAMPARLLVIRSRASNWRNSRRLALQVGEPC